MDTLGYGTDVSAIARDNASAANPFYETAALPTALSSIMRFNIIVRDPDEPISFPFGMEELATKA